MSSEHRSSAAPREFPNAMLREIYEQPHAIREDAFDGT